MQKTEPVAFPEGTYGYDKDFFDEHNIETIELNNSDGAGVLIVPAYQGRVMTSTSDGDKGSSYGWINYSYIEAGKTNTQFNPYGGEERFWLGPEGGPFSVYFKEGEVQEFANWKVPDIIDTKPFEIISSDHERVLFSKEAGIQNASGTSFDIRISREITLLNLEDALQELGANMLKSINGVAYRSDNSIQNIAQAPMTKEGGLLSIWLLSMFNPTESTTVFIPYNNETKGAIVNDDYFGKVPEDRLIVDNECVYFKIDGQHRSKIGIPYKRAKPVCGSYDAENKVLTILLYNLPPEPKPYVNSKWGEQVNAYNGDVVNSYNDGPLEDGSIMGPFYEIETSSPGAELDPRESINHSQMVMHIQGSFEDLADIVSKVFNLDLQQIQDIFKQ